jgi:hypothetical protein
MRNWSNISLSVMNKIKSPTPYKVSVLIPAYKVAMNPFEKISFQRCRDILSSYSRLLICPESLDIREYNACDPQIKAVRFPDHFFNSLMSYSRLCCLPEFYARFLNCEFILIHQLDCYVFEDKLLYWCERDFDYIGAAWPNYEHMTESKKRISRLPFLKYFLRRAGQGGFSLRKTKTLLRAAHRLARLDFLTKRFPEDVLWTTLAGRLFSPFRLAEFDEALRFGFDAAPDTCYVLNDKKLPFGCHGWYGKHADFWKDKIPQ